MSLQLVFLSALTRLPCLVVCLCVCIDSPPLSQCLPLCLHSLRGPCPLTHFCALLSLKDCRLARLLLACALSFLASLSAFSHLPLSPHSLLASLSASTLVRLLLFLHSLCSSCLSATRIAEAHAEQPCGVPLLFTCSRRFDLAMSLTRASTSRCGTPACTSAPS